MTDLIEIKASRRFMALRMYQTGMFVITAGLARKMGVSEGSCVRMFMCNNSKEYYLIKADTGVELKRKNRTGQSYTLVGYAKAYTDELLKGEAKGKFRIGEKVIKDGVEYFTIIYKKNYAK